MQLLFDLARAGARADRVLDAPTSDAWIDAVGRAPARRWASSCGWARRSRGSRCATGAIAGVDRRRRAPVIADYYVAALPVEVMRTLLSPELRAAEPRLNGLDRLVTRWMNGILFYLRDDLPLVRGHAIYIDSEWALTSISQRQFWRGVDFARLGDGTRRRDPLGRHLRLAAARAGGPARSPRSARRDEIRDEVWAQLQDHLDDGSTASTSRSWFLDEDDRVPEPVAAPPTPSRCWSTPPARGPTGPTRVTRIPNLFLAADYVRTLHGPRDDGGRQRGGPARGQRDPRRDRLAGAALRRSGRCASRPRSAPRKALDRLLLAACAARRSRRCG